MADNSKRIVYTIKVETKNGEINVKNLTKQIKGLDSEIEKIKVSTDKYTKTNQGMIDKTGLAGATVQELGRTISDANYGIRGMANNLQQLSSLFVTLIATTGGLGNGLAAIGKVLMGPLGMIILFQTFITLLEGGNLSMGLFSKELRRLNSIMVDGAKAAGSEVGELQSLIDIAKDDTISRKDRQDAVDRINESYPEYLDNLSLETINTKETSAAIKEQIDLLIARAKVQGLTNLIGEESAKIFEAQSKMQNKSVDQYASFVDYAKAFVLGFGNATATAGELTESAFSSQNEIIKSSSEIIELAQEEIKNIMKETPGVFASTNKKTKEEVDKLAVLLDKYKQKLRESEAISRAEVLKAQRDAVLRQARVLGATIKQLQPILDYFNSEISKAIGKEIDEDVKRNQKTIESNIKLQIQSIKDQAKAVKGLFDSANQAFRDISSVFIASSDARIEALKRERDYVLNSESLTKEQQEKRIKDIEAREIEAQKRKIKLERDLFTIKQALILTEEVMKARSYALEQIQVAKLSVSKGVATQRQIAIDAAASIGQAGMSLGAFVKALGPFGIAAFALSIGGVIASIVAARRKAKAAVSSLGAPSSSSGGSAASISAPDFNVVGASPESQLAQTVQSQQQKPLRAFVVHKDIKNASELDRNITETSALG